MVVSHLKEAGHSLMEQVKQTSQEFNRETAEKNPAGVRASLKDWSEELPLQRGPTLSDQMWSSLCPRTLSKMTEQSGSN